ncbi:MAG: hypothetical protein IK092_02955 [Muribaculaceae bacterium]|nr:hypothetical protein [Muribaculaceae bacterium]
MLCFFEINSPLFYTIALVIAVALLGFMFTRRDRSQTSAKIVGTQLTPAEEASNDSSQLTLQRHDDDTITLTRETMWMRDGETLNLVINVTDTDVEIKEKKGIVVAANQSTEKPYVAQATINFLPLNTLKVRYESEIDGKWAMFSFNNSRSGTKTVELKY